MQPTLPEVQSICYEIYNSYKDAPHYNSLIVISLDMQAIHVIVKFPPLDCHEILISVHPSEREPNRLILLFVS